jgi:hypothetical protein
VATREIAGRPGATDSSKIALRQLGKAGFRLAALLTAVFESQ